MAEPKYPIQMVIDNKEKSNSYKENFKRYNKARNSEFYLECLWILYAMIEDRTSAFLYYLGFTSSAEPSIVTENESIKNDIREIFVIHPNKIRYRFDTLSGKVTRIKEVLAWSCSNPELTTPYKEAIASALRPITVKVEFVEALNYLEDEWRDKRNQLTHALFNKKPEAIRAELLPLVEQGYSAVRHVDNAVRQVKKQIYEENLKYNNQIEL